VKLVYVLPVHNESATLRAKVAQLWEWLAPFSGAEVLMVENGSRDNSWELAQQIAHDAPVSTIAFTEPNAGIGYGYDRGITEALARHGASPDVWLVLTAADLPFADSDLRRALPIMERGDARMVMGSKAHPDTDIELSRLRSITTFGYKLARRTVLGMKVGDSQGSMFVRADLAAEVAPRVKARDFFYSTEFCHYVEHGADTIVEVAIDVVSEVRPSSVKPLQDGTTMAKKLWELRTRTRREAKRS
jgi:dolichyl-phosphate beta-glucosyltransferase